MNDNHRILQCRAQSSLCDLRINNPAFGDGMTTMDQYDIGFNDGLKHAEAVIMSIESRLHADLIACGLKNVNPPATPILRQIIKEMREKQ